MIYEYGYFDIYWDACRDDVWIEKVVFQTTGKEIPESDYNYQEFKMNYCDILKSSIHLFIHNKLTHQMKFGILVNYLVYLLTFNFK